METEQSGSRAAVLTTTVYSLARNVLNVYGINGWQDVQVDTNVLITITG